MIRNGRGHLTTTVLSYWKMIDPIRKNEEETKPRRTGRRRIGSWATSSRCAVTLEVLFGSEQLVDGAVIGEKEGGITSWPRLFRKNRCLEEEEHEETVSDTFRQKLAHVYYFQMFCCNVIYSSKISPHLQMQNVFFLLVVPAPVHSYVKNKTPSVIYSRLFPSNCEADKNWYKPIDSARLHFTLIMSLALTSS